MEGTYDIHYKTRFFVPAEPNQTYLDYLPILKAVDVYFYIFFRILEAKVRIWKTLDGQYQLPKTGAKTRGTWASISDVILIHIL